MRLNNFLRGFIWYVQALFLWCMDKFKIAIIDILKSRDFWIRVLFIVIAAFFWFLMKLSKSGYSSSVKYPVIYENIPESKILVEAPIQYIDLKISSYGFQLLGYEIRNKQPLRIDVKRQVRKLRNDIYYWLPNLYREELETQLDAQTSLLRIEPDTVYLGLSSQVKKQVPVVADVKTTFKPGFEANGDAELKPLMVTIAGPQSELDSIRYVLTQKQNFSELDRSVKTLLELRLPNSEVSVSPKSISYTLTVDQFTEKEIKVPIRMTNIPKGYSAEIIPTKVSVFCKVALQQAENLDINDLEVICDFEQLNNFPNRKQLILDIRNSGEGEVTHLSEHVVDFILFKDD